MVNRRLFLNFLVGTSASFTLGKVLSSCGRVNTQAVMKPDTSWMMPDESHPHECTWMAFGAEEKTWGRELLPFVQDNLATIARTIAKYEPVKMLVRQKDYDLAAKKCGENVELIISPLDDLWMRDTGLVFVINQEGEKAGVNFNFNGWGEKQDYFHDRKVASLMAQKLNIPEIKTNLVFEGGGIEVDGQGTAIVTESCILNDNRNPGLSKADCEAELKALLGLRQIIWLPGIAGYDITDGHTDFYARFTSPGIVVAALDPDPNSLDYEVTREHLEILEQARDANGQKLEVIPLEGPSKIRPGYEDDEFAAGYINFYVVNGAVIAPEFGDRKTDAQAQEVLAELFPEREIIQINIDAIAAGGGGIHCTTQQEPSTRLIAEGWG